VRVSRRFAVLTFLACMLLAQGVLAVAFLGGDEPGTSTALPLHPVIGTFEPDDTALDGCDDRACREQAYGNVAFRQGPKPALALLDEEVASERIPADGTCHRIAHTIGAAALARYRGNVARTFAEGSASCWSGYYHGALERSLSQVRSYNPDALGAVVRTLCAHRSLRASPWLGDQCVHGIGHGLMIATGYSLPLSLRVCERLGVALDRTTCKGGVFMENVSSSYGFSSRWLDDDDPLFPCTALDGDDRKTCFGFATTRILPSVDWSWERTAAICAEAGGRLSAACFDSFGRDAASQSRLDPAEIQRICASARRYGHESACVAGAARTLVGNFSGGREASVLCVKAPSAVRSDCFTAVGRVLGRFAPVAATWRADCRAIAARPTDAAACIRGARAGPVA
jgi:hypothetical protein